MRSKEYNNYMKKKELIINKLDLLNVDNIISDTLQEMGLNIKNKYIIQMIKKILFDIEMYGDIKTIDIINKNKDHLFKDIIKDNLLRSLIKSDLPYKNIESNSFKQFIVCCAYNARNKMYNDLQYTKVLKN